MMVFENYSLLPWLTVKENIRLAVDEVIKNANHADKISIVNFLDRYFTQDEEIRL
jgi:nitrate/nitrite transport system ATP-binding protein